MAIALLELLEITELDGLEELFDDELLELEMLLELERLLELDELFDIAALELDMLLLTTGALDALLEIATRDELLATTALLSDEATLVVPGDFEPPPPPQPLSVNAKISILLGMRRDGA